jgi:hypothetical protein
MAKNLSSIMKEMLKECKGDPDLKNQNFKRLEESNLVYQPRNRRKR